MLNLVIFSAVPFGSASTMSDSDPTTCYVCDACVSRLNLVRLPENPIGSGGLPDVVTSHTPPQLSPAYHYTHPSPSTHLHTHTQKTQHLPTPTYAHQNHTTPTPTPREEDIRRGESEREVVVDSLQLQSSTQAQVCPATASHPRTHSLAQLSWSLPQSPHSLPHSLPRSRRGGQVEGEEGREGRQSLTHIGSELRKIADNFQLDNSKRGGKIVRGATRDSHGDDPNKRVLLPPGVTKCLGASLAVLVCWRIISNLS